MEYDIGLMLYRTLYSTSSYPALKQIKIRLPDSARGFYGLKINPMASC